MQIFPDIKIRIKRLLNCHALTFASSLIITRNLVLVVSYVDIQFPAENIITVDVRLLAHPLCLRNVYICHTYTDVTVFL